VPLVFVALAAAVYFGRVQKEMRDFDVYRTAGERVRHGEPLYRQSDGHYQFKYLPMFAVAMAPLALVDPAASRVIWFALSAGLLTAFVRWSVRGLPERRRSERVLIWLAVLFMAKFYAHELTLGQANILLGTLMVAALLSVQVDLPVLAGALVGAAAFVKPYALLLLPWVAFTFGLVPAAAGLAVVVAGLLLPAIVYGWTGNVNEVIAWYRTVTGSTEGNLLGADNISVAAMWAKWIGVGRQATALATITTGALLGLAALVWGRRSTVDNPAYLEFALLLLLIPLVSPQGWDYVLLLGTPATVLLLDRWPELSRTWRIGSIAALSLMGLTIFDLMGRALYAQFMAASLVTVAAIGVAISLWHLRRSGLA